MRRKSIQLFRFFAVLSVLGWMGCGPPMEKRASEDLVGIWETSEPRYAGCTLEITPGRIIFQNPSTGAGENHIQGIEKTSEGEKTLYIIHYEDREGLKYSLTVYRETADGEDVLYYQHQTRVKWTRRHTP